MEYNERLHAPLRWWVQATMLVASFWLAFIVSMPEAWAWSLTAVAAAVTVAILLMMSTTVSVSNGVLRAGRAQISTEHLGSVDVLDAERTKAVEGVEADARAFLVIRPYLKRSVKVEIIDSNDRTPYWLINTRHPQRLADAIAANRA